MDGSLRQRLGPALFPGFRRETIQNVFLFAPSPAGDADPVIEMVEMIFRMRIAGDRQARAGLNGFSRMELVQIEALGAAVDLKRRPRLHRRAENLVEIELVRIALAEQLAGRMGDEVDAARTYRLHDPCGQFGFYLPEAGMDGSDDE